MAPRSRSEFIDAITAGAGRPAGEVSSRPAPKPFDLNDITANLPKPTVLNPLAKPPPEESKGFLGPLGKFIDIIDTPRAALVSGIKEIGDLVQGEGFSARDWWNQTSDNMMFGEVMDDWGVDLPGPLDAVVGFIGDVALDPLTYGAGAGLWLRGAKTGEIATSLTSKAASLRQTAKTAGAAEKTALLDRARKLTDAAVKVERSGGAATAAGREALEEIGLDIGLRTTMFGTGRVGRKLVESPLNKLSGGRLTAALDARRAQQVPKWIGDLEVTASADEIADAMGLLRRGDAAAFKALPEATRVAAQRATKMPVQSKRFLGVVPDVVAKDGVLPWGKGAIEAVFPKPGKWMRAATQRGMIQTLDKALNQKQPIRALLASTNPDMVLAGIEMRRANNVRVRYASQFKTQMEPILEDIVVEARRLGINPRDLQVASEMPFYSRQPGVVARGVVLPPEVNPNLPPAWQSLDPEDARVLHEKVRSFWDRSREVFNELAGEEILPQWADDLYAARFLSDEGSKMVFTSGDSGVRIPFGGKQSPLKHRTYLSEVDFDQRLREYVRDQTRRGPDGIERSWNELSERERRVFEQLFRAEGNRKEFMGQTLKSVQDSKRSIRQQMVDIGSDKEKFGESFKEMYEGDFYTVASRYLRSMADEAGRHEMFKRLADAGVLFKDPDEFLGARIKALTGSLHTAQTAAEIKRIKAAMMAEAAEEGIEGSGQNVAALRAEVSVLTDQLSDLIAQADSARPLIQRAQVDYVQAFKPLLGRAHSIHDRLGAIERLVNASGGLAEQIEAGATGTGSWIHTSLTDEIGEARDAVAQVVANARVSAEMDESVTGLKQILDAIEGHNPASPATAQIKDWSEKVAELRRLADSETPGSFGDLFALEDEAFDEVARRIREAGESRRLANAKQFYDDVMLGGTEGDRPYRHAPAPKGVDTDPRDLQVAREIADAKGVKVTGKVSGEFVQPTGVSHRVTRRGDVVPTGRARPDPIQKPISEGVIGTQRSIDFAERTIQSELRAADQLRQARRVSGAQWSAAHRKVVQIEEQIRLARALAEEAAASGSLSRSMSALDDHHQAVQAFNDHRMLRGFQDQYTEATAKAWGMSGFDAVAASADDQELMKAVFESLYRVSDTGAMNDFFRKYDKFMGWWKAGAVSSPGGFSARNFMGGAWVNTQIAGVEMAQHSKVWGMYKLAMKEGDGDLLAGARKLAAEGKQRNLKGTFGVNRFRTADAQDWKYFDQIVQSGVARSGQVAGEIDTSLDSFARMVRVGDRTIGRLNPFSSEFAPFYQLRNMNERVEFMLRGAVGMDVLQKGGTIDDAIGDILKYHFDYSPEALTQTERNIRRVIPFWRWQKNIIPVLVESMGRKPTTWSRLQQLKGELELQSDSENVVPAYFAENWGVRLPFTAQGSRVYTLPDMPFKSLVQFTKEPTSPMRTFGEMMAPPLKAPIEIWSGKQVFADIPFTGRFQQVPHVYEKIPGLLPIMSMMGKAKKNKRGDYKIRDHDLYLMDQFAPFLGRFRRMVPNEDRYQRRVLTTWLSQVFGTSVRVNDRFEKKNQIRRNNEEFLEKFRDAGDLQARDI